MTHVQTYEVEMCFCGNPNAAHLRSDLCPPTKNPIRAESAFSKYQRLASETVTCYGILPSYVRKTI